MWPMFSGVQNDTMSSDTGNVHDLINTNVSVAFSMWAVPSNKILPFVTGGAG